MLRVCVHVCVCVHVAGCLSMCVCACVTDREKLRFNGSFLHFLLKIWRSFRTDRQDPLCYNLLHHIFQTQTQKENLQRENLKSSTDAFSTMLVISDGKIGWVLLDLKGRRRQRGPKVRNIVFQPVPATFPIALSFPCSLSDSLMKADYKITLPMVGP